MTAWFESSVAIASSWPPSRTNRRGTGKSEPSAFARCGSPLLAAVPVAPVGPRTSRTAPSIAVAHASVRLGPDAAVLLAEYARVPDRRSRMVRACAGSQMPVRSLIAASC